MIFKGKWSALVQKSMRKASMVPAVESYLAEIPRKRSLNFRSAGDLDEVKVHSEHVISASSAL